MRDSKPESLWLRDCDSQTKSRQNWDWEMNNDIHTLWIDCDSENQ